MIALVLVVSLLVSVQTDSARIVDSLRHELSIARYECAIANAEVRRADEQARDFALMVQAFIHTPQKPRALAPAEILPYIAVGSEGVSHADASVFGAIGAEYNDRHFGFDVVARYQYGTDSTLRQRWKTVFVGSLKLYLY